jgi:hypothetical protein
LQVVRAAFIVSIVENAFVDRFAKYVWLWESPGWPGKTIMSSLFRWLNRQLTTKTPRPARACAWELDEEEPLAAMATPAAATATSAGRRTRSDRLTVHLRVGVETHQRWRDPTISPARKRAMIGS